MHSSGNRDQNASSGVPIKMTRGQAVLSFISDPWFPAPFLFLILIGQTIFEKNLMDGIVRYMPDVFMLNYFFETSCSGILLFVYASTLSKLSLMLISDIPRIRRFSASFKYVLGRPNFLDANGSLFFIRCPQTLLTVRILTFISIDMILELMLLVLARIMYLTLAGVSFKTLFLLPFAIRY